MDIFKASYRIYKKIENKSGTGLSTWEYLDSMDEILELNPGSKVVPRVVDACKKETQEPMD